MNAMRPWRFEQELTLFGNFTVLEGMNRTTQQPLPYIAPFRTRVGATRAARRRLFTHGAVYAAAGKSRIDPRQEYATSGYALLRRYVLFWAARSAACSNEGWPRQSTTTYMAMDTHEKTISVAVAEGGRRGETRLKRSTLIR